ncbi:ExbD/TolR family protein [Propionispora vibrioides]|uniref:Outer membrane transport energization protein ExbD n=1 Tax=Propionispora vibrioides TaxID=112903 RepID=A0A1H8T3T8_9FIRM|nr:biopolymer transporter ExbD [Propionispora vibrioides]SEO85475.1 outer membrane transport energization protein ExbD [Propionispora vibrioides]
MKIARNTPKKAHIEIIPMIDTMFFLLVFFMIATLSMTSQNSLPVNLPHANGIQTEKQQVHILTLTKDNKLFYDQEPIASPAEVVQCLSQQSNGQQTSVIINADRNTEHGHVIELMDTIRQAGITKIAVAVNPS